MKHLAFITCGLLLSGCQHFSYQPPYGEDTAEITFTSNDVPAQPVICVPGKGFQPTEYSIAQKPIGGDAMNDLLETMNKSMEVTTNLQASSQARIGVSYNQQKGAGGSRDRCKIALQFEAVAGEHYQAKFDYSNSQCGLSLTNSNGQSADAVQIDWACP